MSNYLSDPLYIFGRLLCSFYLYSSCFRRFLFMTYIYIEWFYNVNQILLILVQFLSIPDLFVFLIAYSSIVLIRYFF